MAQFITTRAIVNAISVVKNTELRSFLKYNSIELNRFGEYYIENVKNGPAINLKIVEAIVGFTETLYTSCFKYIEVNYNDVKTNFLLKEKNVLENELENLLKELNDFLIAFSAQLYSIAAKETA